MPYGALKRPANGIHRVRDGDTVSSVSARYGFTDWEAKVYDAPENAEFKQARPNPNTLVPGDEIFIPEMTKRQESRPTDAWHEFHVVRNKRHLRLRLQSQDNKPLANRPYEIKPSALYRGEWTQKGTATDANGQIDEQIPHTLLEADLILPEDNLRCRLQIGYLRPLPMTDPVKAPADVLAGAAASISGAVSGGASGLMGAAKGAAGAAAGAVGGLKGSLGGGGSGGASIGSGGISGGGGGGIGGAASAVGGAAAGVAGAASGLAKSAATIAAGTVGAAMKAVTGALGDLLPKEKDLNIHPSAQRLNSMGFDAGEPKDNRRTPQFTAALMGFQAWCKEQGSMPPDAGGPLGELTAPGGLMSGGAGPIGDLAGAVAGPMLAAVGLTGQLDEPTLDAIKKTHGC